MNVSVDVGVGVNVDVFVGVEVGELVVVNVGVDVAVGVKVGVKVGVGVIVPFKVDVGVGVSWMFCGVQFVSETLNVDGLLGDSNNTPFSGDKRSIVWLCPGDR